LSNDDGIEVIGGVDPRLMAMAQDSDEDLDDRSITDLVEQPAKVMRIGTMIKQLLEEVREQRGLPPGAAGLHRSGSGTGQYL